MIVEDIAKQLNDKMDREFSERCILEDYKDGEL